MLSNHYTWGQFSIIFIVLFGIQFITHIKGVGHGMMLHQIMQDERHHFMEYIKRIKKLDKDDNIEDDLPN